MARLAGIGTDLIEVARVARAYRRFGERFLERIFTADERRYCMARADWACALAGRFAAKEAAFKALSPAAPASIPFREVAVNADAGRPRVALAGAAAALAAARGITEIMVSISHEREYAVAFAVAIAE